MAAPSFCAALLGDELPPRAPEPVDDVGERKDECLTEQPGLGAEVAEEKVLGDACAFGDLARRGAAVVLAGERVPRGVEQKSAWLAAGPAPGRNGHVGSAALSGRLSLRHGSRR